MGRQVTPGDSCSAKEESEGLGLGELRDCWSEGSPPGFLEGLTCSLAGAICLSWGLGYNDQCGVRC